jgi:hypothetical protein
VSGSAIIFDCEFLTAPGAPQRFWCGPNDPDPVAAQIGAAKLALTAEAEILDTWEQIVLPMDRRGLAADIHPFFARLTGLDADRIARDGVPLEEALAGFDGFSDGAPFWSWGKDEFNLLAISCYVSGIAPPIPVTRFGNATRLFAAAGFDHETIHGLRSPGLPAFLGLETEELQAHDALGDAMAVALSIQHLIRDGRLDPASLKQPLP